MKTKDIVLIGMLGALLVVVQVGLSALFNVELVSLLIMIYTLNFKKKTFYIIYVFVFIEGLLYGFGTWWIMYLYIWPILSFLTILFKNSNSSIFWAFLSGIYGLIFGALCSIVYLFIGGPSGALAYWISGIPADMIHAIANFFIALFLFKPLNLIFKQIKYLYYDK
jgi:energy-coupling factor transport system substrate-specific component